MVSFPDALPNSSILVIEDCEATGRYYRRLLTKAGFSEVTVVRDPRNAMDSFQQVNPDLVMLDLHMPHVSGYSVLEQIGERVPEGTYMPVLVITGDMEPDVRVRCLSAGARDFLSKPFRADELVVRVNNLLKDRHLHRFMEIRNERLESTVAEREAELDETRLESLKRLAVAAEFRDDVTGRHAERVGILAALIGEELGVPQEEVEFLREAAPLHDVGKIGIPDSILLKPGALSDEDLEKMRTHTTIGGLILSHDSFPLLRYAREIALGHHECWDGSGYPSGLAGEEIPLSARIVAVADVFDSLSHERVYKPAYSLEQTLEIMTASSGRQFDPTILEAFVGLVDSGRVKAALEEDADAGTREDATPHREPAPAGSALQGV